MSVRMRHTRGHSGNRRSHHGLVEPRLSTCKDCGSKHVRHYACGNCGRYRNRVIVDVAALTEKREAKLKARAAELGGASPEAKEQTVDAVDEKSTDEAVDTTDPANKKGYNTKTERKTFE